MEQFTDNFIFNNFIFNITFITLPNYFFKILFNYMIQNSHHFSSGSSREFLNMGSHDQKKNTPSMGGIAFLLIGISLPFIFKFYSQEAFINSIFLSIASVGSGLVGWLDDYNKIKYKKGISAKLKFSLQALVALIASVFLYYNSNFHYLNLGLIKIDLNIFYILWIMLIIISTSHAVNIVDGIDGLAASSFIISLLGFLIISWNSTQFMLSLSIMATVSKFLSFNKHPAKIIMGDVGALFLGGFLSSLFILQKIEILLIFGGLIFVLDTLSVILQIISIKYFKKRLFSFSPIHHAFEKNGYSEKKIVLLFVSVNIIGQLLMFLFYYLFFK